jgi:hypothetical protein
LLSKVDRIRKNAALNKNGGIREWEAARRHSSLGASEEFGFVPRYRAKVSNHNQYINYVKVDDVISNFGILEF